MQSEIYHIYRDNYTIVYFDAKGLLPLRFGRYYLSIKSEQKLNTPTVRLNDTPLPAHLIRPTINNITADYKLTIDITLYVHMFAGNLADNNGLILNISEQGLQLSLETGANKSEKHKGFYEENFILSDLENAITPGFALHKYRDATFFVKNLSNNSIAVTLENSPNNQDYDPQSTVDILPGDIKMIPCTMFSKYVRAALKSNNSPILAEVWFQARA